MNIINLTPHPIVVRNSQGEDVTFTPSGSIARVSVSTETLEPVAGFRLNRQVFGAVENLPAPQEGVMYIVSALVLGQCAGRTDVVAPDTGRDAIRNEKGHIVSVLGFVQ